MNKFFFCRAFVKGYIPFERRVRAVGEHDARGAFYSLLRAARLINFVDLDAIEIYQEA